jgi:hypothetical protein
MGLYVNGSDLGLLMPAGVKRIMERAGGCIIRSFEHGLHIKHVFFRYKMCVFG